MTRNPYAGEFEGDADVYDAPPRTSVLAVTSLVLSLICCIPGLGLLGAGFGAGSLMAIGGSRGRIGGRGVAIAGIIIGLLVSIAWVGIAVAVQRGVGVMSTMMYGSVDAFMRDVENGDFDAARGQLAGPVALASDEQLEAFRSGYQAAYGSFVSVPTKFWSEVIPAYMEVGQQIQPYQGRQNFVPVPATFDSGRVLMLVIVDPHGNAGRAPQNAMTMPLSDVWIVLPDRTELRLMNTGGASVPGSASGAVPGAVPGGAPQGEPAGGQPGKDEPSDDGGP